MRIPAAFCGCVGFKPTFGKFSTRGLIAASPTFDHVGFLTRTVEDAEILLRAIPTGNSVPASINLPASVRVGIARGYFFEGLEPQVASAVETAIAGMQSRAFEMWSRFGVDWRTNPGSFSKGMAGFFSAPRPSVSEYESGLAALKDYQAAVDKLFDSVDVIITPTVAATAPLIAGPIDSMKILRNTWPLNAAGTPAVSLPVGSQKLPVGLQLIARPGDDDKLLQIARNF